MIYPVSIEEFDRVMSTCKKLAGSDRDGFLYLVESAICKNGRIVDKIVCKQDQIIVIDGINHVLRGPTDEVVEMVTSNRIENNRSILLDETSLTLWSTFVTWDGVVSIHEWQHGK